LYASLSAEAPEKIEIWFTEIYHIRKGGGIYDCLIGILALLIAFGNFVIALLSFLEKKRRQK
jgi:hypothetical protein